MHVASRLSVADSAAVSAVTEFDSLGAIMTMLHRSVNHLCTIIHFIEMETTHGTTLNAMDDTAVLALIADETATLRRSYLAKGRDLPDVRTRLLQLIDRQAAG